MDPDLDDRINLEVNQCRRLSHQARYFTVYSSRIYNSWAETRVIVQHEDGNEILIQLLLVLHKLSTAMLLLPRKRERMDRTSTRPLSLVMMSPAPLLMEMSTIRPWRKREKKRKNKKKTPTM
jgi:hypothetical protein